MKQIYLARAENIDFSCAKYFAFFVKKICPYGGNRNYIEGPNNKYSADLHPFAGLRLEIECQ
jgi:hypothetical protein